MSPKFKKRLKKSLIQIYTQAEDSYFVLESSLQKSLNIKTHHASHLIGSNALEIGLSVNLRTKLPIKLPALVKTYHDELGEFQLKDSSRGFSSFVLVKKNNLIMRNKTYDLICINNLPLLIKIKTTLFVCLIKLGL
jgi:hypothetical protein